MSRPSDARARLIKAGTTLFRQRGYDGVGLAEILEVSGAPKGSFYHHFPEGKFQLAEACLAFAGDRISALIDQAMDGATQFSEGLEKLIVTFADELERSGFREGCPVTAIALATMPQSDRHGAAVGAVLDDWQDRLIRHAQRLGTKFGLRDAEQLLILVEGAWILGRMRRSKKPMLRLLESLPLPPASSTR